MTDADKPAFLQALARLAIAHREKEPDVVQMRVYFDALKHCAIEFVVEAANRLMAAEFFPRAGAWLREAQAVERERGEAQRALLRKLPTPLCSACADTGWAYDADSRARACECRELRRQELLGRRPWPALPGETVQADAQPLTAAETAATIAAMKEHGLQPHIRVMPHARAASLSAQIEEERDA